MSAVLQTFRHYKICQDRKGGTVEVWRSADEVACLAVDTARGVFVELHVAIAPPERQRDMRSFQALVNLAAPLRHRHVLGVLEGGEDEGANFHVTDFLDGERLDTWLARCNPLPPWLALEVTRQLVEGLCALAPHPRLLAGVEPLHAGVTLTGPHAEDLTVRVCDFGLAGAAPAVTEPRHVEARAIRETGSLLRYMLTGALPDAAEPADLPEDLAFLLSTLEDPASRHHPSTVEQLRALITRCVEEMPAELGARPDRMPPPLRPRLPLAPHFPGPAAAAEALDNDFTLDARPFDALAPYRFRATCRSTRRPVIVQALPPENLMPAACVHPPIDQILERLRSVTEFRHLLAPVLREHAELIVEEAPGQWTLEALVRERGHLELREALEVLRQFEAARVEAEYLGVPLHWGAPGQVAVVFAGGDEAVPPAGKRGRLPLAEWPEFLLKFRPWPTALNFTQAERFLTENLPSKETAAAVVETAARPQAVATPPGARDLALLAAWMLGGAAHAPDSVKPLLYDQLARRGASPASARAEFLERFAQRLEPKTGRGKRAAATAAGAAGVSAYAGRAGTTAGGTIILEETVGRGGRAAPTPAAWAPDPPTERDDDGEDAGPSVGFAEALFGGGGGGNSGGGIAERRSPAETERHALFTPRPVTEDFEDEEEEDDGSRTSPFASFPEYQGDPYAGAESEEGGGGWPMLLLVVVLISAALAALIAHFSGMAVWL